ncbi:MAG TPA: 4-hydroxy-tetrahydrodipicolinate reductase [Tissierellia bacterium]|nr:4-hydroxy-tetrahydrodipicolinate reductase [Tissierellia bacterium]
MNLVLCGVNGAMGKVLLEEMETYENIKYIGALSPRNGNRGQNIKEKPHAVIDFSHTSNLEFLLEYSIEKNCALLICTTGFNDEDKEKIKEAGKYIPVMLSSNTSFGVNALRKIVKSISTNLNGFGIDIVERHHNKKIDTPSGTAKTLVEDIKEVTGRENVNTYSLRAGSIPGEHSVIFSGVDEILEIKHVAYSKKIFARGALDLIQKLYLKEPGFYLTEDFF